MSVNNEDLRNGECTSCEVVQDKSAYWTPALFFLDAATGKYETVGQVGGILAYVRPDSDLPAEYAPLTYAQLLPPKPQPR